MEWRDGLTGGLPLEIWPGHVESCSGPGPQDENIRYLRRMPYIANQLDAMDQDEVRRSLREYGAWDAGELADHGANLDRILWIACCDLREQANEIREESIANE